jgi:hypothetical protein
MHANQLARLAADIADRHGQTNLSLDWPAFDLETYWTVCQRRRDLWQNELADFSSIDFSEHDHNRQLARRRPVFEEILVGEILARVWTAAYDVAEHQSTSRASLSAVRSIWLSHQESRMEALKILNKAVTAGSPTALSLNRLRRKTERWSDVILAHLGNHNRYRNYAVDRDRLRDFQEAYECDANARVNNWSLYLASLSKAFPIGAAPAANPSLNAEIHRSIRAILPDMRSNSDSQQPRPLFTDWVWQRLESTSRQMDDWLESYLG